SDSWEFALAFQEQTRLAKLTLLRFNPTVGATSP
ncbi:MAG: hypothetical protein ACI8WY_003213, partial [Planctomycetota bacterium]